MGGTGIKELEARIARFDAHLLEGLKEEANSLLWCRPSERSASRSRPAREIPPSETSA
jgi:hypothetical protein